MAAVHVALVKIIIIIINAFLLIDLLLHSSRSSVVGPQFVLIEKHQLVNW